MYATYMYNRYIGGFLMLDIIDVLNQATKPIRVSEAYLSVSKKTTPYWDKIGEVFPAKF